MDPTNYAAVLEITDGNGNLLPDALNRVLATMFHPDNPERRQQTIDFFNYGDQHGELDRLPPLLVDLYQAKANDFLASEANGVFVSGTMLLTILSAATHRPRKASLARAIAAWCRAQASSRTLDGHAIPASERAVRRDWSRFKPVAHFCAAFVLDFDPFEVENTTILTNLPKFIAIAEGYRIMGESHHPPGGCVGSKPLIATTSDPAKSLRMPPDLHLPKVKAPLFSLTEFTFQEFSDYRAD